MKNLVRPLLLVLCATQLMAQSPIELSEIKGYNYYILNDFQQKPIQTRNTDQGTWLLTDERYESYEDTTFYYDVPTQDENSYKWFAKESNAYDYNVHGRLSQKSSKRFLYTWGGWDEPKIDQFEYDGFGHLSSKTQFEPDIANHGLYTEYGNTMEDNRLTHIVTYSPTSDATKGTAVNEEATFVYNDEGLLIEKAQARYIHGASSSIAKFTYDPNNRLTEYEVNYESTEHSNVSIKSYTYNETGNIATKTIDHGVNRDGHRYIESYEYIYDLENNQVEEIYTWTHHNTGTSTLRGSRLYKFNSGLYLTHTYIKSADDVDYPLVTDKQFQYDENDNLISIFGQDFRYTLTYEVAIIETVTDVSKSVLEMPNISLYPNPATQNVTIDLQQESTNGALKLFDLQGHHMISQKLNIGQNQVRLQGLHPGVYVYQINTSSASTIGKLIIY